VQQVPSLGLYSTVTGTRFAGLRSRLFDGPLSNGDVTLVDDVHYALYNVAISNRGVRLLPLPVQPCINYRRVNF
jgi:hypothetical protein